MKPGNLIVAGMAAGAIALMAVTPALASGVPLDNVLGDLTVAPDQGRGDKPDNAGPSNRPDNPGRPDATPEAGDGDEEGGDANINRSNRPDNAGRPDATSTDADGEDADGEDADGDISRGNRPDSAGRPENAGPSARAMPTLPENASPRALAAVTAAYEQQGAIQERVAAIRGLEAGPGRTDAMNALMADFGELLHSVSDAVHAVEVGGGGSGDAELASTCDAASTEGDGTEGDDATSDEEGDGTGEDAVICDDGSGDGTDDGSGDGTDDGDGDGDGDETGDDDGGDDDDDA